MTQTKFIVLCISIIFIPPIAFGTILIIAFGQNASPTPTTIAPPQVTTSPSPNLQYVPQKAYIVTTPDGQVQAVPVDDDSGGIATGQAAGIVGIIAAIGAGIWNKMSASKDVKQTNSALLNTKEVQKEIARVMFNFQPDQSKALSDAPAIKLENLEKDKQEFAEKVAKS